MNKLHAFYRENKDRTWDATIEFYPFILVEEAPCLESAKEMLLIYAAEEFQAKHGKRRYNWSIDKETVEYAYVE